MKGDFTRFTFKPQKHYRSVLMQQGRVQLDADWNEQALIQEHFLQSQALDMIGVYGAAKDKAGNGYEERDSFNIIPLGSDLAIAPGSIYVNGILCELESGTPFSATATGDGKLQVKTLIVDNRQLKVGEWLEILDDDNDNNDNNDNDDESSENLVQIKEINAQQELLLEDKEGKLVQPSLLRRVISYKNQLDFPQPPQITEKGYYLVYLDVWQRHITAIEDVDIREVALNAFDTTTRIKTVWQVKLLKLKQKYETVDNIPEWKEITAKRNVYLTANDAKNSSSQKIGNSQIGENQLYRVEIHQPGKVGEATVKWSRDNGTTVFAINKIESDRIVVKNLGRDTSESFNVGQWVEVIDDIRELQGKPGTLVRLTAKTSGKNLVFDAATILGDSINSENFPKANNPKVRRWDDATSTAAVINLNNEIEVKFEADSNNSQYHTGDYWLIPVRTVKVNGHNILWEFDGTNQPLAQPPQGIKHQYCPLALVNFDENNNFTDVEDLRETFPPLSRALDSAGGIITGNLIVNQSTFLATNSGKVGIGTLNANQKLIVENGNVGIGYNDNQQTAALAIKDKVGIGTLNPTAKLEVAGDIKSENINIGGIATTDIPIPDNNKLYVDGNSYIKGEIHVEDIYITGFGFKNGANQGIVDTSNPDWLLVNPENVYSAIALYKPVTINNGGLFISDSNLIVDNLPQQPVGSLNVTQSAFLATNGGNVGIGTQNPTAKLEVTGDIKAEKINIGGTSSENTPNTDNLKLLVNGNVGIGYNDTQQTAALAIKGNVGIGSQNPTAKLEVAGDVKITGERLRNAQNQAIIHTGDSNLLKLNPDSEYSAIALYKPVTINNGGLFISDSNLIVDNLPQQPVGSLNVTQSAFLATNGGNVGIGTQNPTAKLEVAGDVKIAGERLTVGESWLSSQGDLQLTKNAFLATNGGNVGIGTLNANQKLIVENGNVGIGYNDTQQTAALAIKDNVGIGTQNPTAKLEVTGDIKAGKINIGGTSSENTPNTDNPKLLVNGSVGIGYNDTQQTAALAIKDNVGIGTLTPTAKLEVTGDIKAEKINIGGTPSQSDKIPANTKLYVDGDIYLTGKIYPQEDNTSETNTTQAETLISSSELQVAQNFFATPDGNVGVGTSNPQAKLEVAGDIKIAGNRLRNTQNKAILDTSDSNLLQVNPDSEYSAIALYNCVAIDNGGLSIGELSQTPRGNLIVTQNTFLATTGGNVNIGTQSHQANLKVAGLVNIGSTPINNIPNTANLKLSVEGDTYIAGNLSAQQYFQVSSREMKENITELSIQDGLQILQSLNPVKFSYKNDETKRLYAGFISENTDDMFTTADKKMLNDTGIVAILTKVVKEYVESNSMLHQVIQQQQQEMVLLRERVKILEQQQKKQSFFNW